MFSLLALLPYFNVAILKQNKYHIIWIKKWFQSQDWQYVGTNCSALTGNPTGRCRLRRAKQFLALVFKLKYLIAMRSLNCWIKYKPLLVLIKQCLYKVTDFIVFPVFLDLQYFDVVASDYVISLSNTNIMAADRQTKFVSLSA